MWSNCILFALALFLRRRRLHRSPRRITVDGERYVVLWRSGPCLVLGRRSRLGSWLPHVLYAETRRHQTRIVHFVPRHARVKKLPPPLFLGRRKFGDSPHAAVAPPPGDPK